MKDIGTSNPQDAIDQMPQPQDPRITAPGRVPPENRYTYSTPNYSKGMIPDPPISTTNFPIKSPHPQGAA